MISLERIDNSLDGKRRVGGQKTPEGDSEELIRNNEERDKEETNVLAMIVLGKQPV